MAGLRTEYPAREKAAPSTTVVPANQAFFAAHFASAASSFFFGSFRCSSQRNRNRGPFDRFLQPGYRQLMSRLRLLPFLATPLRPALGIAAEMRSAKIWAKRSARASNGCEERLGIGPFRRRLGDEAIEDQDRYP
jgi:hypothetical protein